MTKAMLQASAFPMTDADGHPHHVLTQGAGSLNTAGSLTLAQVINPTLPVGSSWQVMGVTKSTTIDGQNIVWGDNIVFAGSGTTPGVGVPMVLISGRLAAERITGPDPTYQSRAMR